MGDTCDRGLGAIRIDAKRQALDALDNLRRGGDGVNGNGKPASDAEIETIVEVGDDLTSQSRHSLLLQGSPPSGKLLIPLERRDVRVVEGARLESVCRGNSTVGSNPTLSANLTQRSPHANDSSSLRGDEMGLGKTIQALAASEIMARQFGVECHFE